MIDVAGALATWLRRAADFDDPGLDWDTSSWAFSGRPLYEGVGEALGGEVFVDRVPPDTLPPFILIQTQTSTPTFVDVGVWESVTTLIEIVGQPEAVGWLHLFATRVRDDVSKLRGMTVNGVVVQAVGQVSGAFGFDSGYSPAHPRWVLTVPMTVRSAASH